MEFDDGFDYNRIDTDIPEIDLGHSIMPDYSDMVRRKEVSNQTYAGATDVAVKHDPSGEDAVKSSGELGGGGSGKVTRQTTRPRNVVRGSKRETTVHGIPLEIADAVREMYPTRGFRTSVIAALASITGLTQNIPPESLAALEDYNAHTATMDDLKNHVRNLETQNRELLKRYDKLTYILTLMFYESFGFLPEDTTKAFERIKFDSELIEPLHDILNTFAETRYANYENARKNDKSFNRRVSTWHREPSWRRARGIKVNPTKDEQAE